MASENEISLEAEIEKKNLELKKLLSKIEQLNNLAAEVDLHISHLSAELKKERSSRFKDILPTVHLKGIQVKLENNAVTNCPNAILQERTVLFAANSGNRSFKCRVDGGVLRVYF